MSLAHLHPKANICAKFHENWWKTEEVVRDARLATDRPTDRLTDRPTTRWFLYTPLYTTCMRGTCRRGYKKCVGVPPPPPPPPSLAFSGLAHTLLKSFCRPWLLVYFYTHGPMGEQLIVEWASWWNISKKIHGKKNTIRLPVSNIRSGMLKWLTDQYYITNHFNHCTSCYIQHSPFWSL